MFSCQLEHPSRTRHTKATKMVKCFVKSCDSRSEKHHKLDGITFHTIPKDHKRKEKWIKIIRLLRQETDWWPSNRTVICSKHFQAQDIMKPMLGKVYVQLSKTAVPIVMDDQVMQSRLSAKLKYDLNVDTDEEMLEILESPGKHEMRKMIQRLKFVARRRLRCIRNLRQQIKTLKNKNKKLSAMVKKKPHPQTLLNWYNKIHVELGFTSEAFKAAGS